MTRTNRNMAKMNQVAMFIRNKLECSMGEIDIELGVSPGKQYELHRCYKQYFPDVMLSRGRWKMVALEIPVMVPIRTQEVLRA